MHREIKIFTDAFFRFFQPVIAAAATTSNAKALMLNLGYLPPEQFRVFDNLRARVNSVRDVIEAMAELSEEDIEADPQLLLDTIKNGVESISGLISDIQNLPTIVQSELNGSDLLAQTDILERLPLKLYDYLTIRYLKEHHNRIYSALKLFGIIEIKEIQEASNPFYFPRLERTFHWDKLAELLTSPMQLLKASLKDNSGYFYEKTMLVIQEVGLSLGLMPHYKFPDPDVLKFINNDPLIDTWPGFDTLEILRFPLVPNKVNGLGLDIYPLINTTDNRIKGLVLVLRVDPGETVFVINDNLKLGIELSGIANGLGIVLDENDEFRFVADLFASPQNLPDNVQFDFRARLTRNDEADGDNAEKLFQLGTTDGNRFEVGSYNVTFGVAKQQNVRLYLEAELLDGFIRMKFDGADGFISKVIGDGIESDLSFGIGFSNDQGFYFAGSSGLEIELPTHITLGPLQIRSLSIGITSTEEKIAVTFASSVQVNMGPVTLLVRDIGVSFPGKSDTAVFVPNVTFKPPTGVGLVIDAKAVTGAGHLDFYPDRGEYLGAAQLRIKDKINVKAIGIILTKPTLSFLLLVSAEFPPVQLGLGFKLNGVGGLVGIHRGINEERLFAGLRDNTLDDLLFPEDPIKNIHGLIGKLNGVFPPTEGQYTFGLMGLFTWGAQDLVTIKLGLIVEFPTSFRLAVVGTLKAAVTKTIQGQDVSILHLQVNFAGLIDFDEQFIRFDAALYQSTLLGLALEGEMALRLKYGANPDFVMTLGGFHPDFQPPALRLPADLRRLQITLRSGNPHIWIDAYLAVTANTFQFGAGGHLRFSKWGVRVSGDLGFDALFQFSPFRFEAGVYFHLSASWKGHEFASIEIDGVFSGPSKWRIRGQFKLKICWFLKISVSFDESWGDDDPTLLGLVNVLPLLVEDLRAPANWERLPGRTRLLVSTRQSLQVNQHAADLLLHPNDLLTVRQNTVPLGLHIDKFSEKRPQGASRFTVALQATGGTTLAGTPVKNHFAPGQFFHRSDEEKLQAKSYELFEAGAAFDDLDSVMFEAWVGQEVAYESAYVDEPAVVPPQPAPPQAASLQEFQLAVRNNALANSALARRARPKVARTADQITEHYVVANQATLGIHDNLVADSETEARLWLRDLVRQDPRKERELTVLLQSETL